MKTLRILPSAAGVIALTATIGFVDGQRENERISRNDTYVSVMTIAASDGTLSGNSAGLKPDNPAYLVKIDNGDLSKDVLVDAITGNILRT
jgi:uncharacterized membrane protein YkoI